jgi:hypothetical protein
MYNYCEEGWPVGIDENGTGGIIIYPNPTNGFLNIETRLDIDVEVYDMMGKLVISEQNSNRIDITSVPNGIYNMVILHEELRITKKVIKH